MTQQTATPVQFVYLNRFEYWLGNGLLLVLLLQIIVLAQHTFTWRYGEDVGFFYYFSWLVNEHDYLPYRDLHETSFPGSFILYSLVTRITGYSVLAYNITHMLLFSVLCIGSLYALRHIHLRMAIATTLLFGAHYFFMHRSSHMQRDFLVLMFVVFALGAMSGHKNGCQGQLSIRSAFTGFFFGIAASIKPHAALAAPFVVLLGTAMSVPDHKSLDWRALARQCFSTSLISLLAFIAVWLGIALWLIHNGSWPFFYEMLVEYMPLYQKMNGNHIAMTSAQRWQNALDWFSGTAMIGMVPASIGLLSCYTNRALTRSRKLHATMLFLLGLVFLVYVSAAGKFWDYHQIPANYFGASILSLCFVPYAVRSWPGYGLRIFYLCIAALFIKQEVSPDYALALTCLKGDLVCNSEEISAYAIEDKLEAFLRAEVKAGERVEPLATSTLGPLFPAMLRAGIEPSTPYLEGFPLYHDADSAYVQQIRIDMLQRLQKNPPRFMIRPVNFFAPGGSSASPFNELDAFIAANYEQVNEKKYPDIKNIHSITILERKK